jgi:hypothetical protein
MRFYTKYEGEVGSRRPTNRLPNSHKKHAFSDNTIRVVKMQHAQAGLQAVETETRPRCEVISAEALIVHDLETGHVALAWDQTLNCVPEGPRVRSVGVVLESQA